ncbi:hypothetical protein DY000_02013572 [Brassica cretica]|uniref:Uncharacterized protein n=1 Tax=Brassica cretica TaxID=69181 RepID=A0ABQ7CSV1_BRACR|nr:hypothetical protein DY000_02013572 [Brassica cretica]
MSAPASDDAYERVPAPESSSIYSRIWISDLAPGSSPLERSNGSGGDSVSTGFVGIGDSCGLSLGSWRCRRESDSSSSGVCGERCRLWLFDSCSRCFLISNLHCSALVFALCVKLRVLLFGSRRLQVWGDSRLQSLIAQWLAWFCSHPSSAENQLFLCSGAAFPLFADYKASGRGFGGTYNRERGLAFGCGMRRYQSIGVAFSGSPKLRSVVACYIKDTLSIWQCSSHGPGLASYLACQLVLFVSCLLGHWVAFPFCVV